MISAHLLTFDQIAAISMVALVVATMFVIDDKRSFASPRTNQSVPGVLDASQSRTVPSPHTSASRNVADSDLQRNEVERNTQEAPRGPEIEHEENRLEPLPGDNHGQAASLDERIASIAAQGGLTPRESEVFALLARGRSIPYVRDALVISRETAATHAKHIYAKLGVHSRQELIDLAAGVDSE